MRRKISSNESSVHSQRVMARAEPATPSAPREMLSAILSMIMKTVFTFKSPVVTVETPAARIVVMPEALDIVCPCCDALLKVDPGTSSVIWADKKKPKPKDFDDLVRRVGSRRSVLDQKFARSVQQTRHASEILDKKFEEARKRAESDDKPPPHPFEND